MTSPIDAGIFLDLMMPEQPTLPAEGAFVVQFSSETNPRQGRFAGRVEHVVSGKSCRFQTLNECLGFIRELLDQRAPRV